MSMTNVQGVQYLLDWQEAFLARANSKINKSSTQLRLERVVKRMDKSILIVLRLNGVAQILWLLFVDPQIGTRTNYTISLIG